MKSISIAAVTSALESIAPLSGAADWDNAGWILQHPKPHQIRGILLCLDLTRAVVAECARRKCNLLLAYHPPIFQPVRQLVGGNPLQAALLEAAARRIHVYSPHTALDAAPGGLGDWLAGLAGPGQVSPLPGSSARLVELAEEVTLRTLARRLQRALGAPAMRVSPAVGLGFGANIRRVAVCAGSGASALRASTGVEAWITGEMPHHDLLAARARGTHVLLCEHTRTERPYLPLYAERIRATLDDAIPVRVSREDREIVHYLDAGVAGSAGKSGSRKTT